MNYKDSVSNNLRIGVFYKKIRKTSDKNMQEEGEMSEIVYVKGIHERKYVNISQKCQYEGM